jgi:hypothetical protein
LVALLQRHAADPALAAAGCYQVGDLVLESPATLGEAGAAVALLAAMRAHAADEGVQQWGCIALYNLVYKHAANLASARAAGAAGAVRTAMGNHPGNGYLQGNCRNLLKIL